MIVLVLVLLLALPAAAEAGVVKVQDNAVVYIGDAGNETVELVRARDPDPAVGEDRAYQFSAGDDVVVEAPCTRDDHWAYCPASAGELPVRLIGNGGDDTLSVQVNPGAINVPVTLDGGDGNDRLDGAYEATTLLGGAGDDIMSGDSNRSRGVNADGRGADVFHGGDGVDEVSYYFHAVNAVTVTIDGVADDGAPGEGDNVMPDVENLEGLISGSSNFTGSPGPNELHGSSRGTDTLSGGGGNDRLLGFDGADTISGGDGDDYLEGGFGDDRIEGGAGKDSFVGDRTERDVVGVGNDVILARDGVAELVSCGPGSDRAEVDADDTVAGDGDNQCETVERPAGSPGPGTTDGWLFIKSTPVRLSRARGARISVTCLAKDAAGCNGTLRLARGKRKLASRSFSIAPGRSARITLKLSKQVVRRLKRAQKVTVTATSRPAGRSAKVTLTLRRR
jgi:Ca2+-binding RTX toxin-like protein